MAGHSWWESACDYARWFAQRNGTLEYTRGCIGRFWLAAALTQADVTSCGTADTYLKATHLTRTRHAHRVTLLTLHQLRKEAFMLTDGSNDEESFGETTCRRIYVRVLGPDHEIWNPHPHLRPGSQREEFPSVVVHWQALVLSIWQDIHSLPGEAAAECHEVGCCMYTPLTVWRNLHGKKEARVCAGKCLERQNARQWDGLPSWLREQEGTLCLSDLQGCTFSWPPAKAVYVTSGQAVVTASPCKTDWGGGHQDCSSRTACTRPSVCVRRHRCCCHPCWHIWSGWTHIWDIWVAFGMGK